MAHISSCKHTFDQKSIIGLHAVRQLITELLLEASERTGIDDGEPPEAEVFQCAHTISDWIIRCETDVMEARDNLLTTQVINQRDKIIFPRNKNLIEDDSYFTYRAKACKPIRASDESMAISHAKALLKDCAVTIRVDFKLH